jgi:tetratricopeptide (TPR) repeat protein
MLSPSRKHRAMADFFISYTQADRAWAEWIAWVLEEAGYEATIQTWDFRPGNNFASEMHKAAGEAERTLIVLSPDYLKSEFGQAEWNAAFVQDPTGALRKLLPVRVREVKPGGLLKAIVSVDIFGLDEKTAESTLLTAAVGGRGKPKERPIFPGKLRARFPGDLGAVPENDIPDPSPLPEGSRMPLSLNPLFVGRREDLKELACQLKAGETSAIGQVDTAAATGLGGIGKTQLACEFVHRYGRFFEGGVFWMSFADPAAVPAEVAACGVTQDLHPDYQSLPLEQRVRLVEESWQSASPRLLVFDNCEDEALILRWRPHHGGARVLVTSRRAGWDPGLGVKAVPLRVLPRPASIELLRRFRPDVPKDHPILDALADELGDLPLALHLAGSFLQKYEHSPFGHPASYLEALRQEGLLRHPSLQGRASPHLPTGHEAHVGRTFALSFERLDPEEATDALAISLLSRAAYFAPGEAIPRELLLKTVELGSGAEASMQAEDALRRLLDLGLFDAGEEGAVVLHRLIVKFAREAGEGETAQRAVERALYLEANRLNKAGVPGPLLDWQPHLRAVTVAAWEREDEIAAFLCSAMDYHLLMVGDLKGARPFSERALAIQEKTLGPEHSDTARSLNNLGALLWHQGDLAGARPYYERALAIREKVLSPEHPDTARSLNNLGFLLQSQGDLAGARPYFERALAIWEKVLGPEHPDTALSLNNLGGLLDSQGDLAGARPYYERALAIFEARLGLDHPRTKIVRKNLESLGSVPAPGGGESM